MSNSSVFGRGGGLVPTSLVDLTPPEREQSSRPGTGTEEGLGLGWFVTSGSIICKIEPLVVNVTVPTKTNRRKYCTLFLQYQPKYPNALI